MSRGGVSHGEHRLATVGGCLELDVPPASGRGGKPAWCASPEYSRAEMASWAQFSASTQKDGFTAGSKPGKLVQSLC